MNTDLLKVKLTIGFWDGKNYSKPATRALEGDYGIASGNAEVRIRRIPRDITLPLQKIATKSRSEFNAVTSPFEDGGWRVVKASKYAGLLKVVEEATTEFNAAKAALLTAVAGRQDEIAELNSLVNDIFQLHVSSLGDKYSIAMLTRPVTSVGDMQFPGITEADTAIIRKKIEAEYKSAVSTNVRNLMHMAHELLTDIRDKLPLVENTEGRRVRIKNMLAKAKRLAQTLRDLNISDDPDVYKMADEIDNLFSAGDTKAIRGSQEIREEVGNKVGVILGTITGLDTPPEAGPDTSDGDIIAAIAGE